MRRCSRRRTKRSAAITEISLTPLIDTALTLLVIFMITSPMMHNAIKVDLPKGAAKEDVGLEQDIEVYIDQQGTIFCDGQKYEIASLITLLKTKCMPESSVQKTEKEKTVYVKADTTVSYGRVLELVDHIKVVGGIKYVALATQKRA